MHATLLLTDALIAPDVAGGAVARLEVPRLERLAARAVAGTAAHDAFDLRMTSAQRWLSEAFGLDAQARFPVAPFLALQEGIDPGPGELWCADLVHLRMAADHVALADPSDLGARPEEIAALLESAGPVWRDAGIAVCGSSKSRLFLQLPGWSIDAVPPECAIGRDVSAWMPAGDDARRWRRASNEIQMIWHSHEVNQARDESGAPAINSLWLHGGGAMHKPNTAFDRVSPSSPGTRALAQAAGVASTGYDQALKAGAQRVLIESDALTRPALAQDWGAWLAAWRQLDRTLVVMLDDALANGRLDSVDLVLCGQGGSRTLTARRSDRWKLWRDTDLATLLSDL